MPYLDAAADGYVKAEAVSCLVVKRLETALRDRDPIRAVVRGIAINSNGRTNGIGSPSSEAQAAAIRKAYANAGIADLNETQYLECHGTGTKAGDAIEVAGVAAAFADTRDPTKPLIIGSVSPLCLSLARFLSLCRRGKANCFVRSNPTWAMPSPQRDYRG